MTLETPPSPWVVRFAPRIRSDGRVLDLAAGRGRHTRYLLRLGYQVLAVDQDVAPLASLRVEPRLQLMEADLEAESWPLAGRSFAGIVVTNYLYRPRLELLSDALTPGGVLIYDTFSDGHERYGRPTNPDYLLRQDELRRVFEPRLEIVAHDHHRSNDPPAIRQRLCAIKREAVTG